MKKLLLIPMITFLVTTGCEKESSGPVPITQPPAPPPPVLNTPPRVSAVADIAVHLPVDTAFLSGSATDAENNIESYRWRQLSGPSQAIIQTPNSLKTKVLKLIKGEYSFELTVIDKGSLSGTATTNIVVVDTAGTNTIVFKNLYAGCWGGECLLVMDGSSIPRNIPINVFFKSEDSLTWMEAIYFFSTDHYFRVQFGGGDLEESKKWEVMVRY